MICHQCESEDVTLTAMNSPIIIDQVEVLAVCQDCGAEHEHSIAGGDFELIEPDESGGETLVWHPAGCGPDQPRSGEMR